MIMHARMNERTNECMVHLCYQKTAGAMEPETYQVNAVIVCPDTKQEIHVAMVGAAVKPQVRTSACTAIYMRMLLRTCLLAAPANLDSLVVHSCTMSFFTTPLTCNHNFNIISNTNHVCVRSCMYQKRF